MLSSFEEEIGLGTSRSLFRYNRVWGYCVLGWERCCSLFIPDDCQGGGQRPERVGAAERLQGQRDAVTGAL